MCTERRGQSEVIGVVLLTAVVVVIVSVTGAFLLSDFVSADSEPNLSVDAEVTSQNVTLGHRNGNSIAVADLDVVLRADGTERYAFSSFTQLRGTNPDQFSPGDRWYRSHGLSGDRMEILVIHTPTNAVIERQTVTIEQTLAARFTTNVTNPTTLDTIEFDGSDSFDREGTITSYDWDFDDGTTASGEVVAHSYDENGTYDVTLTVETEDGRTASRTKTIEVFNPAVTASFTFEPENPSTDEDIDFNASDSESPDGEIVEYEWDFDDGRTETVEDPTIVHSYSEFDSYEVRLTVTDDNGETSTTIETITVSPPFFEVTIDETNAPVFEGEELVVNTTVENTGSETGTQTVELSDFDGTVVDSEEVTLDRGGSTQVQLRWQTTGNDAGTDEVTVTTDNDTDTATVTVEEPAIRIFNAQPDGENIVDFDVENTQDSEVTLTGITLNETSSTATEVQNQNDPELVFDGGGSLELSGGNAALEIDDTQQYTLDTTETIAGGATTTGTLEEFDGEMIGKNLTITLYYEIGGESEKRTETVTIDDRPYFDVEIIGTNSPIASDDVVEVEYRVENTGTLTGTQDIRPEFDGDQGEVNEGLELGQGESDEDVLTYDLDENFDGEPGEYDVTVFTDDESASTTVDVVDGDVPFVEVEITDTNDPVPEGDRLLVNATITNTGEEDAIDEEITLDIEGIGQTDTATVSVDAGESTDVTLEWQTGDGNAGEYEATVSSDDDSDVITVRVTEDAEPQFEDLSAGNVETQGQGQGSDNIDEFNIAGSILYPDSDGEIEFELNEDVERAIDMTDSFDETFDVQNEDSIAITVRLLDESGDVYQVCESDEDLTADNDLDFDDFSCG